MNSIDSEKTWSPLLILIRIPRLGKKENISVAGHAIAIHE